MACSISIFSRSGESEYRWLLEILRKEWSVSPFVITNRNYSLFCEEIYKCSFAILYHSRNRGRVNITDVTDSLYDVEVKTMFEALGRHRLIIVIDDLDDSSDDAKNRILGHQHTLKNMTQDIFLFTTKDKANTEALQWKMELITRIISRTVSVRTTHIESKMSNRQPPGSLIRTGSGEKDHTKVHVPGKTQKRPSPLDKMQGPEEDRPGKKENTKKIVVSLLSCFAFWNTYYFPGRGNALVALLWAAVMGKVFYNPRSAVLPLATQGRFILSCTLTLLTVYNTYHRPSIFNVASSALWISSCFMYSLPRRQQRITGPIRTVISYGPVLLIFWQGWQQTDAEAETTFQMISRYFLRTPAILAAEGI